MTLTTQTHSQQLAPAAVSSTPASTTPVAGEVPVPRGITSSSMVAIQKQQVQLEAVLFAAREQAHQDLSTQCDGSAYAVLMPLLVKAVESFQETVVQQVTQTLEKAFSEAVVSSAAQKSAVRSSLRREFDVERQKWKAEKVALENSVAATSKLLDAARSDQALNAETRTAEKVKELSSRVRSLTSNLKTAKESETQLRAELAAAQKTCRSRADTIDQLTRRARALADKKAGMCPECSKLQAELDVTVQRWKASSLQLIGLRSLLDDKNKQITELRRNSGDIDR